MHKLSFKLAEEQLEFEDGKALCLTPHIHIDGAGLTAGAYPTNTLGILALGARSDKQDILTCSCGVAGCAGFQEEVVITREGGLLHWDLPTDGYDKCVADAFGPGPWRFTFEVEQYEQALAELERQLLAREQEAGPIALLSSDGMDSIKDLSPLAESLAACRQWTDDVLRDDDLFAQCFSGAAELGLRLRLTDTLVAWISVRSFSRGVARNHGHSDWSCRDRDWEGVEKVWREAAQLLGAALRYDESEAQVRALLKGENLVSRFMAYDEAAGRYTYEDVEDQVLAALDAGQMMLARMPE